MQNLLLHLSRIDQRNHYVLFVNGSNCHLFPNSGNFCQVGCWVSKNKRVPRLLWEQLVLPARVLFGKIDVLFCPANLLPLTPLPCRSVLTVHDLICWHIDVPRIDLFLQKYLVRYSARKADRILAVSEYTKRDIVAKLRVAQERIFVTYEAPDEFPQEENTNAVFSDEASAASRKYLLAVGTTHRHKNLVRLLDAYALLKERHRINHTLVIAGTPGSGHAQLLERVAVLNLKKDVSVRGRVSQAELLHLYRSCDLFVFPSIFEGFGLPLLEAMSCGAPVVSSNAGSLPEIGGDAAIYFDPLDVEDMADKIMLVLQEEATRKRLSLSGHERVRSFSWEKTARETLSVIEDACRSR